MGGWVVVGISGHTAPCPLFRHFLCLPLPIGAPLYPMLSLTHRSKLAQWAKGGGLHLGGAS